MNLTVGVQHPVKAAFRTDIKPAISQNRHDLPGRKRREFRLVASEQNPLAFFFAEAVRHMAVAALTTVDAITVASKLPTPALQRRQPNTQELCQLTGPSSTGHGLIKDVQGLLAIIG